ncbi:MAG: cell division protein FtsZ [Pseudomonadota bacterium]
MSLNLTIPQDEDHLKPRITVIGVGGAGGNAVNNMIASNLSGVEFLVSNTDAQSLTQSACQNKLQLGRNLTRGLGAGARPDIGRAAAEEAMDEIMAALEGCNMVFITAGMGGGTGTGAAPVIARAAREQGILTVGVVTKPFHFEGVHRMRLAEAGMQELTQTVDTLIIIPNQNLFRIANEKTTFADAFKMADDVLEAGVRGVTDLMVLPGLINLDFNDIRTVMTEMGKAMMGTGESDGEGRAIAAAEAAIANPLLDDVSMRGARGVLINITGGPDLTLFEVDEAANKIREQVDPEANIIFGSTFDEKLEGKMRVSIVATGIDAEEDKESRPGPSLSLISNPAPRTVPGAAAAGGGMNAAPMASPTTPPIARTAASRPIEAPATSARAPMTAPQPMSGAPMASAPPRTAAGALRAQANPIGMGRTVGSAALAQEPDFDEDDFADLVEPAPSSQAAPAAKQASPAEDEEARKRLEAERFIAEIEGRQEGFIAPEPLVVEQPLQAPPEARNADAFRSAEMANASSQQARQAEPRQAQAASRAVPSRDAQPAPQQPAHDEAAAQEQEPEPRRSGGLFARVSGLFHGSSGADSAQAERAAAAARAAASTPAQSSRRPTAADSQAADPAPRSGSGGQQTRLNLDEGRREPRMSDDQMLDIPAFLRRQSN